MLQVDADRSLAVIAVGVERSHAIAVVRKLSAFFAVAGGFDFDDVCALVREDHRGQRA